MCLMELYHFLMKWHLSDSEGKFRFVAHVETSALQGFKQGDSLSPFLFGISDENTYEILQQFVFEAGIQVGDVIFDLLYADNYTLKADRPKKLQLDTAMLFCKASGMKLYDRKTEITVFGAKKMRVPLSPWLCRDIIIKVFE